jgi:2-dehydropantoate 2-reductase
MKIAIIGAGAIGSVAAAYLTKTGKDVTLIGKQEQVDAVNERGLHINGVRGEEIIKVKMATKLQHEYDLLVFTVKTQDIEDAFQQNQEFLEKGLILTSQNGVQADNILSVHIDKKRLYSSIVMFGATYIEPGKIIFNFEGDWIIGKPFELLDPTGHTIGEELGSAFKVVMSTNVTGMKWCKLFVNFNNCIPALLGKSMQETFSDLDMCKLSVRLLKEGLDIVSKANIGIEALPSVPAERFFGLAAMPEEQAVGIINKTMTGLSKEPLYGSVLQSIKRGRASEIDFINGEIVQLGKFMHADVKLNEMLVDMVHEVERTGKFFSFDEIKQKFGLQV